jgi:hypothetical protein
VAPYLRTTLGMAALALGLASCGSSSAPDKPRASASAANVEPKLLSVTPADNLDQIMKSVNPGDTVLLGEGVYQQTIRISTPDVTLVGTDRNQVVIDAEVLRPNGIVVTADGVTVANLTVRNALLNGVLVTGMSDENGGLARGSDGYTKLDPAKYPPLQGFHVTHVTSYNNGLYGIYLFNAQHGLAENTYTSGGADSGLYVGQCKPCNIVVRNNVMERNAVGYEHTNAGPDVWVVENRMSHNRVGVTINSNHQEALLPQEGATLAGNLITDNNYSKTPEQGEGGFALGVGVGGGTNNLIAKNRISNQAGVGLALASVDDLAPINNEFRDNLFVNNREDFVLSTSERSADQGNCMSGNRLQRTRPGNIAQTLLCPDGGSEVGVDIPLNLPPSPRGIPFTEVQAPPQLPGLKDPAALGTWNIEMVPDIDLLNVRVPDSNFLAQFSGFPN